MVGGRYQYPIWEAENGERYIELSGKDLPPFSVAVEQVVGRLLKGVVNISDIIAVHRANGGNAYYSRIMPLDHIEKEVTPEEFEADLQLLRSLLGDDEHNIADIDNFVSDNGKTTYFDFGKARWFPDLLENETQDSLGSSDTVRAILRNKLITLRERFSGPEGRRFIEAVIKGTDKSTEELFHAFDDDVTEDNSGPTFEEFYTRLTGRIDYLLRVLEESPQTSSS